ncbi:MAG: hypothetical protein IIC71_10955 [Acidobacteria bacterium]|nr:hypothetical protein [Acidobacteriota bacterium]
MAKMFRIAVVALVAGVLLVGACATAGSEKSTGKVKPDVVVAGSSTSVVPAAGEDIGDPTTTNAVETSTTVNAVATPATTTEGATFAGTFDDPAAAGEWIRVGGVEVVVTAVDRDAADVVLEENLFNDPPSTGTRFVMWLIGFANTSDTELSVFEAVSFTVVGDSAVAYEAFDAYCGVVPDSLDQFRTVFPGGSFSGNLCWEVAEADVESLRLIVDEFGFSNDRAVLGQPPVGEALKVTYPVPVPPDATGERGSRGNPLALGDTVVVGDWEISILAFDPDATTIVLAENQFNTPPPSGRTFVTLRVSATYVGQDSDILLAGVDFRGVGDLALSYGPEDTCGVVPDDLDTISEVFPGGEITGNLCWSVDERDVESLLLYMFESFSFGSDYLFVDLS